MGRSIAEMDGGTDCRFTHRSYNRDSASSARQSVSPSDQGLRRDLDLANHQLEELCNHFAKANPTWTAELRKKREHYLAFLKYPNTCVNRSPRPMSSKRSTASL